jgi:hypothetical protein
MHPAMMTTALLNANSFAKKTIAEIMMYPVRTEVKALPGEGFALLYTPARYIERTTIAAGTI